MHAHFTNSQGTTNTLEALVYDMPFDLVFRKAVRWNTGKTIVLKHLNKVNRMREASHLRWQFAALDDTGFPLEAIIEAPGPSIHVLLYLKTDCCGTFAVPNASFANATLRFGHNRTET